MATYQVDWPITINGEPVAVYKMEVTERPWARGVPDIYLTGKADNFEETLKSFSADNYQRLEFRGETIGDALLVATVPSKVTIGVRGQMTITEEMQRRMHKDAAP